MGTAPTSSANSRTGFGGKLRLTEDELLPLDPDGFDLTGNNNNWWIGLSLVHTLFAREHNAVCDMLSAAYPKWSDDRLFHTARLVVAALIAKIHTIEWTPTLLDTPLLHRAMHGNWWGILGETIRKRFGRLFGSDILSGIMGSKPDHHGTPYAMTEEFTAVYRMHPLLAGRFPDPRRAAWRRLQAGVAGRCLRQEYAEDRRRSRDEQCAVSSGHRASRRVAAAQLSQGIAAIDPAGRSGP